MLEGGNHRNCQIVNSVGVWGNGKAMVQVGSKGERKGRWQKGGTNGREVVPKGNC